jgi:hypothetical protein
MENFFTHFDDELNKTERIIDDDAIIMLAKSSLILSQKANRLQPQKNRLEIFLSSIEQSENKEVLNTEICQKYSRDLSAGLIRMSQNSTGYPDDMVRLENNIEISNQKTSPTNIGLYIASIIASRDMQIMSSKDADLSINKVLTSLEKAKTDQGLFHNWYDTSTGYVIDSPNGSFISTVDNAWLAAGLITLKNASPVHAERSNEILKKMNFQLLYDKDEDLFYGGYNPDNQEPVAWHYDIFNTEGRIASYVGISNFGIPNTNYHRLSTCEPSVGQLSDEPVDRSCKSWGGSMFEMLMPTLLVPEEELNPNLNDNITKYIQNQIEYGINNDDGYWGYSPCYGSSGYCEAGIPDLAIKEGGYGTNHVITPHAILLSLSFIPKHAVDTLEKLKNAYPIYKEGYGFDDSINLATGETAKAYLSLDQSMSLIAICNYLSKNGGIRRYFSPELQGMQDVVYALGSRQPSLLRQTVS